MAEEGEQAVRRNRQVVVRLILLFTVLVAGNIGYRLYSGSLSIPARWNPLAPYEVDAPPGPLTAFRYWRTVSDPQRCAIALAGSSMRFQAVPDFSTSSGCAVVHAVRVESDELRYNHPFIASCPLALGMARFEKETVQPLAQAYFQQRIREIDHVGSYACRGVRTNPTHSTSGETTAPAQVPLSEHAHANALDITGFVLADGRRVTIERDWQRADNNARFLHAVHAGACNAFNTTLGPDYNALHKTHFHIDMGTYRVCR